MSPYALERYSRHLLLPHFGKKEQTKLSLSSVLVVGAGGLGNPVLQYLAAAGVGKLGIVDDDTIALSNLQRQVMYGDVYLGRLKAEVAAEVIIGLNPSISTQKYCTRLSSSNALAILENYDVIVDCTDNFPTRYLLNDAAVKLGKPLVFASIYQYQGQLSVFNTYQKGKGFSPNLRDLFPQPPPPESVTSCAEGGVLGVLPGIIGSMQANEVIKLITHTANPLSSTLLLFDATSYDFQKLNFTHDPSNPVQATSPSQIELIDYEAFCGIRGYYDLPSISVADFFEYKKNNTPHQLIDIREPFEYDIINLGGKLIPMATFFDEIHQLPKDLPIILHCKSGKRSAKILQRLHELLPDKKNYYHLEGGLVAYYKEIESKDINY